MRLFGAVRILTYHRVASGDQDPFRLCVHPERFAEQLQTLKDHGSCLTVRDLVSLLDRGQLPRRAFVVTFDDGYADNLIHARPLVEKYDIPMTLFLSTGIFEDAREFWWDELEQVILRPGDLPSHLSIDFGRSTFTRELGAASSFSLEESREHQSWWARDPPPTQRHAFFFELWRFLHPLPAALQRTALDQLAHWASFQTRVRPSHRPLTSEEAHLLATSPIVEIGAHTRSHPLLPAQSLDIQSAEIRESKRVCEAVAGRQVTNFSYPYGESSPATARLVEEAGFSSACSTKRGSVRLTSDRFQFPRLHVQNWNGKEFAKQLAAGIW
jgi:peptidoglycan/xylan/chitin deacetylase (PgdA/CDA1 family)